MLLLLYAASYLMLTLLGGWRFSQTGELRYGSGLSVSDIEEWHPKGLWWQGHFKDIYGNYVSRGDLLGYFYSPLIALDRRFWHRTKRFL